MPRQRKVGPVSPSTLRQRKFQEIAKEREKSKDALIEKLEKENAQLRNRNQDLESLLAAAPTTTRPSGYSASSLLTPASVAYDESAESPQIAQNGPPTSGIVNAFGNPPNPPACGTSPVDRRPHSLQNANVHSEPEVYLAPESHPGPHLGNPPATQNLFLEHTYQPPFAMHLQPFPPPIFEIPWSSTTFSNPNPNGQTQETQFEQPSFSWPNAPPTNSPDCVYYSNATHPNPVSDPTTQPTNYYLPLKIPEFDIHEYLFGDYDPNELDQYLQEHDLESLLDREPDCPTVPNPVCRPASC
ncbi:hypothetical protein QR680_011095 [Steinernema hermaphroditum]|uniref:BZIP domain-containing protein n=1 Tax=Steinernema hermaphroditum TaxID=289476 RepID=A0AA39MBQ7_9BILA|nr:hypothetical protein QR680_011095 [Steinernema hermaphroditum]